MNINERPPTLLENIEDLKWQADQGDVAATKKLDRINDILVGMTPTPMQEAEELIYGDREKTYGDPSKNLARIAEEWTSYLQKNLRTFLESSFLRMRSFQHQTHLRPEDLRELTKFNNLDLTVTDVCRMMQRLKDSRDENMPKRDNIVDNIGYAGLIHRCREPEYERSVPVGVEVHLVRTPVVDAYHGKAKPSKSKPKTQKRKR